MEANQSRARVSIGVGCVTTHQAVRKICRYATAVVCCDRTKGYSGPQPPDFGGFEIAFDISRVGTRPALEILSVLKQVYRLGIILQSTLTRLVKIAISSLGRPVGKGLLQSLGSA